MRHPYDAGEPDGGSPISAADGDAARARQPSDSAEQRRAELIILARLAKEIHLGLSPQALALPGGSRVEVDGVSSDGRVLVEVFAHQGALRGGQFHKVARDALKLITISHGRSDTRKILAFADEDAARCVRGKSWLAEALQMWAVEVRVVQLDEALRAELRAAQTRQVMVNRSDETTDAAGSG